jgi:hypothetical protein
MNRRKFLTMLGLAPAVAAAAPLLKRIPESDADYYRRMRAQIPEEKRDDLIGGWVSYRFHYTVALPPDRSLFLTRPLVLK